MTPASAAAAAAAEAATAPLRLLLGIKLLLTTSVRLTNPLVRYMMSRVWPHARASGRNRLRRKLCEKYIAHLTDFCAETAASVTIGREMRTNVDKVERRSARR
jgi:hypothetical protein